MVAQEAAAGSLTDLDKEFRQVYALGAQRTMVRLRATVPVLVNRFGQIALYRPNVESPEIYSMDMNLYLETRSIAHTAVAIHAGLVPFGYGRLTEDRLAWLSKYTTLLKNAELELVNRSDVPADLKAVQLEMLEKSRRFAESIFQRAEIDQVSLAQFAADLRKGIEINLDAAAASQLNQFRDQIARWKAQYPDLKWDGAVVVLIGMHQARDQYVQRQFFDWMLHDNPKDENQVVFAETLTFPPSLDSSEATDAMTLLAKVMLDKSIAMSMFSDPLALQSDVLGDAAKRVIVQWPPSEKSH